MNPSTPLSMAVSATKDKLQASAHDIWSSLRSLDDIAKKPTAADDAGTPKSPEGTVSASLERIENVFKIMFGSCTNGGVGVPSASSADPDNEPSRPYEYEKPRTRSLRSSEFVSSKDLGDHVYAQLFRDDLDRASRAVDDLREQDTKQKSAELARNSKSPSRQFLHPFPVSSPTRRRGGPSTHEAPPPTSGDIYIANNASFDDCISAISAHTLEDMARVHEEKANSPNDSKGFFSRPVAAVEEISYPLSSRSRRSHGSTSRDRSLPPVSPIMTPLKLARGRSSGTHASRATRSSRCTYTTNSTQDSDFANVFYKQEQKYWDDVVEQDKKNTSHSMTGTGKLKSSRRRSRCGSSKDHTVATASSSSYASSYMDKQARNIIHFESQDANTNIAVAHNSQLCEI